MSSFSRGPSNVDDLLSSTLDKYRNELFEQWAKGNVLTKKLLKDGAIREIDGGNDVVEHLNYQLGGTAAWTAKNGTVSVSPAQQFTDATFPLKMLMGSVVLYDWEEAQNAGQPKMFDLLEARLNNLREEMDQAFEYAAIAAVTANTSTMWSLLDIVDSANPGVANYGGIDRSTYTWFQAYEAASGSMSTQGLEDIRLAYTTTSRGMTDPVAFHITTQTLYNAYNARLISYERLAPKDQGDLEFDSLAFHGKPVLFSEQCASGLWFGINSKYTKLVVNKNMKFKNQPFVRAQGGINKASIVQLMCQLISTRPASNFKLTSMTA